MQFSVDQEVFTRLKGVCFGVVVARGINNKDKSSAIDDLLADSIEGVRNKFQDTKVKEYPGILPYREAFLELGYNPNKFACSIEALSSRIVKGSQLPSINNIVNLANAVSLKYVLPLGAHDMDLFSGDISIRFSCEGDSFLPFGINEAESVEPGELVYASGNRIKTRRWIWRQSEEGKITEASSNIFFPIDGFRDRNYEVVISARDELVRLLKELFDCDVQAGFVDENNPTMRL